MLRSDKIPGSSINMQIRDLLHRGCENDNPDEISKAIFLFSSSSTAADTQVEIRQRAFRLAFRKNAPKVLTSLLQQDTECLTEAIFSIGQAHCDLGWIPYNLIQILLDHGWNINDRGGGQPLLWTLIDDADAVRWCLDRGATVLPEHQKSWPFHIDINDTKAIEAFLISNEWSVQERVEVHYECPPILELAASRATVAIFELLRSKGAPLGWRTLHKAVEAVETSYDDDERMKMVRHLIDNLKLDVNSRDQPPGGMWSNFYGRPLHYVAKDAASPKDIRGVTMFLLDRGADPELLDREGGMTPLMYGKQPFLNLVEEWRALQKAKGAQSDFSMTQANN